MKTFKAFVESKVSDRLAQDMDKIMDKIDDSMSVVDFALATAKILNEQYGSHNFDPFMETLKDNLEK